MRKSDTLEMEYGITERCCARCEYFGIMSTKLSCSFFCKHPKLKDNCPWENQVHPAGVCKNYNMAKTWQKDLSVHEMVVGG